MSKENIAKQVEELGFTNIKFYDVDIDGYYYDAGTPNGEQVEVQVLMNGTRAIQYRHLGVKSIAEVEWFQVGTYDPNWKPQLEQDEEGQLRFF